ncbi:hypothetical protein F3Y22_tig00013680pilonHSYRG00012 [Hibiscus syriacus]|uniref:tRNA pseudouridine synthase n=1 Tax=Hibiscus syriacus TaxID=106335 RepID=A0A6A3C6F0_HIBSY|nr:hypothetical protein F3Y22_tig00013680pilonHSYRG00012 [Hibiscus syriacus]
MPVTERQPSATVVPTVGHCIQWLGDGFIAIIGACLGPSSSEAWHWWSVGNGVGSRRGAAWPSGSYGGGWDVSLGYHHPRVSCWNHLDQEKEPPLPLSASKWEPFRKKKVVMRVGYVGTGYRGLQLQRDEHELSTIEKELETAIFKAGGIRDRNYENLHYIAWARSSRTDKSFSLAICI